MKTVILCSSLLLLPILAMGQAANEVVQRSSSPTGLHIRDAGATAVSDKGGRSWAPSAADDKDAPSAQQSGSSAVQIQGNTSIKANARNLNTSAVGVSNAARNEVGAIGK